MIDGSRRIASILLIQFLFAAGLAACDDESNAPKWKTIVAKKQVNLPEWLTIKDKMDPAVWLRSREVGHEVLPSDPEVGRLHRAFSQAAVRFFEDERMIANRTAQTSDTLAEVHQPERAVDIITGMIDVADTTSNRQLYSDMCQQYLNMRKTGADRTDALQQLSVSYKAQNNLR